MRRLRAVQWGEVPAYAGMTVKRGNDGKREDGGKGRLAPPTRLPLPPRSATICSVGRADWR